ncbi:signaling mucin MSB2-like [Rhagoletis pomonella]|uniref:signaling mucin MSB2-like n=1 Tax=Rhagoletis pomonella TaxID=28610 RepID=UPI00177B51A5|nr:signaling mucin MSB2-like [Rhagoletis pomonella]
MLASLQPLHNSRRLLYTDHSHNMNIEQHKFPPPPPPSASLLSDSGYTNGYATPSNSSITTTSADTSASSPASQTTTYVNIPIIPHSQLNASASSTSSASPPLPPPPPSAISMMGSTNTPGAGGGTSTFKTPLLPMPTLEDIEGGLLAVTTTSNTPVPMPVGILKYPNAASAAAAASVASTPLSLPPSTLSMCGGGMGPGPPLQSQTPALSLPASTATSGYLSSVATTYQSAAHAHQQQQQLPPATLSLASDMMQHATTPITVLSLQHSAQQTQLPPPPSVGILNSNSGVTLGISGGSNASAGRSNHLSNVGGGMGGSVGAATGASDSKRSSKCCTCFGSGNSSSSTKSQQKKRCKQKSQTIWSALLTNLGICALLLAYTLLGSFIFLTIESEDSTFLHHHHHHHSHHAVLQRQRQQQQQHQQQQQQQQRTLASTKRGSGSGGNVANIYHTSPEQTHLDNGTALSSVTAYSSLATSSSSSSASLASSSASLSGATYSSTSNADSSSVPNAMLEGIVPLSDENGDPGAGDFSYGDELSGDGVTSAHLALSADTQEVRQRTIENIWDITVSLNILYKENWTKLAALEIAKFQDQLIKRLNEDALLQLSHEMDGGLAGASGSGAAIAGNSPATEAVLLHTHGGQYGHGNGPHEWNFAKAFLYSLTVLTTIGYGNIAPRTTLGRLVTLVYAIFGIPLTLVYLSSTGGILAKVAREVFSKALCCCLCSNCGYCCYDEKRMAEKERRMKRKRQQEELRKQQAALQEPYFVHDSFPTTEKQSNLAGSGTQMLPPDIDSLSASESRGSMHGLSILAPILLCLSMMVIYILIGAVVLYRLEDWPILDGIYFCFMSLSTIGFGDMLPGLRRESTATTWFCSIYIMSGMALTAMCFNVIHEEIVHRIKIVVEFKKGANVLDTMSEEQGYYMPP